MVVRIIAVLAPILVLANCATPSKPPDLGGIYNHAAQIHGPDRNPIIVIPGVLGSRLIDPKSGKLVWGAFSRKAVKPNTSENARLIALPMEEGKSLSQLKNRVAVDGALDRVDISLLGVPLQSKAYYQILTTLGANGYQDQELGESGAIDYGDDHYTCFQFAYDWRRDNAENAALLYNFIQDVQQKVAREHEKRFNVRNPKVKVDIVAHSMGGLLTRYMLRYGRQPLPKSGTPSLTWAGANLVDKVIIVATPNAGSSESLLNLQKGFKIPLLVNFDAALLGSMPSLYQLLPRPRHKRVTERETGNPIDFYQPATWKKYGWGLMNPNSDAALEKLLPGMDRQTRERVAYDHLSKCLLQAKQFSAALDRPAKLPSGIRLNLFVGDSIQTTDRLQVSSNGATIVGEKSPGDGTVARYSALMDERISNPGSRDKLISPVDWSNTTFIFDDHLGLTKNPMFVDTMLFELFERPR